MTTNKYDLRKKAIEKLASFHYNNLSTSIPWNELSPIAKNIFYELVAPYADLVLEEVAQMCDIFSESTVDQHGNFFGTFGWDHSSNEGAATAFDDVALECRAKVI